MSRKPQNSANRPCQLFEFLLQTRGGIQVVTYTIPGEDADRLAKLFGDYDSRANRQFMEIPLVNGRVVLLNLSFLIGAFRLNVVGRMGDQDRQPVNDHESGVELQDWQSLSNSAHPPDLALLINGLEEPLICRELAREVIALAAMVLQEEPATEMVTFTDEENLRTRYISTEKIILMESIEYH